VWAHAASPAWKCSVFAERSIDSVR
jgi:hypothetical protein